MSIVLLVADSAQAASPWLSTTTPWWGTVVATLGSAFIAGLVATRSARLNDALRSKGEREKELRAAVTAKCLDLLGLCDDVDELMQDLKSRFMREEPLPNKQMTARGDELARRLGRAANDLRLHAPHSIRQISKEISDSTRTFLYQATGTSNNIVTGIEARDKLREKFENAYRQYRDVDSLLKNS